MAYVVVCHQYCSAMPRKTVLRSVPMQPRPDRFDPGEPGFAEAMTAHDRAVAAAQGGYLDPRSGLFVMTASVLAARGHCCNTGCRHCPYEY